VNVTTLCRRGGVVGAVALMASIVVSDVSAATTQWSDPVAVTDAGQAKFPQVALSSDGTAAMAVWFDPSDETVKAATATIDDITATWSSPHNLVLEDENGDSLPAGGDAGHPQVGLSSDGTRAVVVWFVASDAGPGDGDCLEEWCDPNPYFFDDVEKAYVVAAATATVTANVATWSTPQVLSTGPFSRLPPQPFPQVGLSSDGTTATAVWIASGTARVVQASSATINDNTADWSDPVELTVEPTDHFDPQLALSDDGTEAVAVWGRIVPGEGGGTSTQEVQAATATINGKHSIWSVPVSLSTPSGVLGRPEVALSSHGTAVAVWRGSGDEIVRAATATIAHNAATWSTTVALSSDFATPPQVGLSDDGTKAVAVWGIRTSMQAATATIASNVATWSTPANLNTGGRQGQVPQVAVSSDGTKAATVWQALSDSGTTVGAAAATITDNAADWSTPVRLSPDTQKFAVNPQVAMSSDGTTATAVWADTFDGSVDIVRSASARLATDTPPDVTVSGFAAPVDGDMVNVAKAGRTIPLKFRVTSDGAGIEIPGLEVSVTTSAVSCGALASVGTDDIETYTNKSGLQYLGDGNYQWNWQTKKSAAGCRALTLTLSADDYTFDSSPGALFQFTR
jgi:hypothetical protein